MPWGRDDVGVEPVVPPPVVEVLVVPVVPVVLGCWVEPLLLRAPEAQGLGRGVVLVVP